MAMFTIFPLPAGNIGVLDHCAFVASQKASKNLASLDDRRTRTSSHSPSIDREGEDLPLPLHGSFHCFVRLPPVCAMNLRERCVSACLCVRECAIARILCLLCVRPLRLCAFYPTAACSLSLSLALSNFARHGGVHCDDDDDDGGSAGERYVRQTGAHTSTRTNAHTSKA